MRRERAGESGKRRGRAGERWCPRCWRPERRRKTELTRRGSTRYQSFIFITGVIRNKSQEDFYIFRRVGREGVELEQFPCNSEEVSSFWGLGIILYSLGRVLKKLNNFLLLKAVLCSLEMLLRFRIATVLAVRRLFSTITQIHNLSITNTVMYYLIDFLHI
jgi:hypothetical protein